MAMKVKNNLGAVRTLNTLGKNSRAAQKNLRKVATGERITSAADDASAYGISERMREKIRSFDQANQNTQNDLAMMKTAEGAVANIVDVLRTLKQKAIDSANDSNTDEDRRIMQKEVDQLLDQIDDNALVTFNGKFLVNGNMSGISRMVGAVWICEGLYCPEPVDTLYNLQNRTLTQLQDRDGKPLQIEEGDTFTISHVVNGNTYTRTEAVGNYTLRDLLWGTNYTYPGNGNYDVPHASYYNQQTPVNTNLNGITSGMIVVSGINGDQYVAQADVAGIGCIVDKNGKPVIVPNPSESAVAVTSVEKAYQLSGLNIIIRDGGGNFPRWRGRKPIDNGQPQRHARFGSRSQK